MNALQVEIVAGRVIQTCNVPPVIVVAIAALRAEAGGVRVVRAVAAVAILGNLFLVIAAAMAGGATDLVVRAEQSEAGLFQMVVLRRLPLPGGMAFRAGIAACAAMLVIGRVTSHAGLRSLLVGAADVARVAGQAEVRSGQAKLRPVVVEFGVRPGQRAMALPAGLRELAAVRIVGLVATHACRRGLAKCSALFMTCRAIERRMRACKLEVG